VVGYTELLDLGYTRCLFFCIGAYTAQHYPPHSSILSELLAGDLVAVAALAGVILGSPALGVTIWRSSHTGEIVPVVFRNLTSVRDLQAISRFWRAFCVAQNSNLSSGLPERQLTSQGEAGINPIGLFLHQPNW